MSKFVRKYNGVYIDGMDKVSDVTEYTPPKLTVITEDYRAGGMDMATPMDMGMEPMEATIVMTEDPSVLGLFGLRGGRHVPIFVQSVLEDDDTGTITGQVEELRGKITSIDEGSKGAGFQATTLTMKLTYYKRQIDGKTIHEIDPPNMVRVINGVDQLADYRRLLGR